MNQQDLYNQWLLNELRKDPEIVAKIDRIEARNDEARKRLTLGLALDTQKFRTTPVR